MVRARMSIRELSIGLRLRKVDVIRNKLSSTGNKLASFDGSY